MGRVGRSWREAEASWVHRGGRDVDRPAQSPAGAPRHHEAWRAASMQALVSRKLRASPVVPISILFMT